MNVSVQIQHTAIAGLLAALVSAPAVAGDLEVSVAQLRSGAGEVRVAVCPRDSFTKPSCPYTGTAPAGRPVVMIRDLPDGDYAVQAFHDEDGDGDLDRQGLRLLEGIAFSRDAPMRFGPPRFRDAKVRVRGGGRLTINMRYTR